jgi:hypothetical protein
MNPAVLAGRLLPAMLLACALPGAAHAAPDRLDIAKRARASTEQKAVLPETKAPEQNLVVGERRFVGPGEFEKKSAVVGERRSGIAVEETREKSRFVVPETRERELIERRESVWNGRQAPFSTREDAYRSQVAVRFQDRIGQASRFDESTMPVTSQRTTFDRVNRFSFRRNGDTGVSAGAAGAEAGSRDVSGESSLAPGVSLGPPTTRTRVEAPAE